MKLVNTVFTALATSMALVPLCSCDKEFDLSKEFDSTVQIGSGFIVPLGQSDKIPLSRIIKSSDNFAPDNDGVYTFSVNGNFKSDKVNVKKVEINGFAPVFGVVEIPTAGIPPVPVEIAVDADIFVEAQYDETAKLPSEVQQLSKVWVATQGNDYAYTYIDVSVRDFPDGLNSITITDVCLQFPELFDIRDYNSSIVRPQGEFVLSKANNHITLPVSINSLTFSDKLYSKYISGEPGNLTLCMQDKLVLTAKAKARGVPAQLKVDKIIIDFVYHVGDVNITHFAGVATPNLNVAQIVNVNGIPDVIAKGNNKFNLNNLRFDLNFNNPVNMDVAGALTFVPLDKQGNEMTEQTVNVEVGDVPSTIIRGGATTPFTFTNNKENQPDDRVVVYVPDLNKLFETIPDKYVIKTSGITAMSNKQEQRFALGQDYVISGDYVVTAPMEFSNIQLEYTDSIKDVHKKLKDVSDKVSKLKIKCDFETTIPVDMDGAVAFYDAKGNELKDIVADVTMFKVKASPDGVTPEISPVEFTITIKDGSNQLNELDLITYTVFAKSLDHDIQLNASQYLLMKNIKVHLPDGIKFKL